MKHASKLALVLASAVTFAGRAVGQPVPASQAFLDSPPAAPDAPGEPSSEPLPLGAVAPAPTQSLEPPPAPDATAITVAGYVETYYQLNVRDPSNGTSNLRVDHRHNSITLQNAVIDVQGARGPAHARIAWQLGAVPPLAYSAEPAISPAGSAPASAGPIWQHLQQAWAGGTTAGGLAVDAGVFLSPLGPESLAVKDDWNWSRSNLFFALPFYHAGVRVTRPLGGGWTGQAWLVNGWNDAVDRNHGKSAIIGAGYAGAKTSATLLYNGGVERPPGAAEGDAWRHLIDANATYAVSDQLSVLGHVNAGIEPGDAGTTKWAGAAAYVKYAVSSEVDLAARGDYFREWQGESGAMTAGAIFFPVEWVASATVTGTWRPAPNLLIRAEYRHDQAPSDVFFDGDVAGDGTAAPFVPNAEAQDTITLGAVAYF